MRRTFSHENRDFWYILPWIYVISIKMCDFWRQNLIDYLGFHDKLAILIDIWDFNQTNIENGVHFCKKIISNRLSNDNANDYFVEILSIQA